MDTYVADGTVRYGFIQFPILGEASVRAAIAAECAGEQGKFLEYHNALFEEGETQGEALFTGEGLVGLAQDMGLDSDEFSTCLTDGRTLEDLQADKNAATAMGVRATPTIFINDVLYEGLRDIEFYKQKIDELLNK